MGGIIQRLVEVDCSHRLRRRLHNNSNSNNNGLAAEEGGTAEPRVILASSWVNR